MNLSTKYSDLVKRVKKFCDDRKWSLDFKNPAAVFSAAHHTPAELLSEIEEKEKQITTLLGEMKK